MKFCSRWISELCNEVEAMKELIYLRNRLNTCEGLEAAETASTEFV